MINKRDIIFSIIILALCFAWSYDRTGFKRTLEDNRFQCIQEKKELNNSRLEILEEYNAQYKWGNKAYDQLIKTKSALAQCLNFTDSRVSEPQPLTTGE